MTLTTSQATFGFLVLVILLVAIVSTTLMRINPPDHEEEIMTTDSIHGQKAPIAFIVEPTRPPYQPYLTIDPAVAEKRKAKGDIVTPYASKRPTVDEDEL